MVREYWLEQARTFWRGLYSTVFNPAHWVIINIIHVHDIFKWNQFSFLKYKQNSSLN